LPPPLAPRREGREAQSRADDAVHLFAQQQLGECELLLRFERRDGLISDAQDDAARRERAEHFQLGLRLDVVLHLRKRLQTVHDDFLEK